MNNTKTIISDSDLVKMAQSFWIDELFEFTLERVGENSFVIRDGNCCLNKISKEFVHESLPSGRTKEFISETRFKSLNEALEFYIEWRKNIYVIIAKSSQDYRWTTYCMSDDEKRIMNLWNNLHDKKPGKMPCKGVWVLIGKNFEVIEKFSSNDDSSSGVIFDDRIARIAKGKYNAETKQQG